MVTQLLILFGTDKPDKMLSIMALREDHDTDKLANIFEINNTTTLPLRLHNGPYDFRATPNAGDPSDTTTRLALLKKYLPLLTSRGCPYPCKFCVIVETNNRKWRKNKCS